MGFKSWLTEKSIAKGKANIRKTLAKLIPVADAAWNQGLKAVLSEVWPMPKPVAQPQVFEFQKELLKDLVLYRGPVTDKDTLEVVGSMTRQAGDGAKMAVRWVMTSWMKDGTRAFTVAEVDEAVGWTEAQTAERQQVMRDYAIRHLAAAQAAQEILGGPPLRPGAA
jgi:hypothetical protein